MPIVLLAVIAAMAQGCGGADQPGGSAAADADVPGGPPAGPADDVRAVSDADEALMAALENGEGAALGDLLDVDFTWLVPSGVLRQRDSIVASVPRPIVRRGEGEPRDVHRYGSDLAVVQRHNGNAHSMHVWARREPGWRLLHISEVVEGERVVYAGTMIGAVDCVNPCKVVPFVPATAVEQAVMEAWQAQQSGPEQWARHIPDGNIARTSNGSYTKADRVAVQMEQIEDGAVIAPSPLQWARVSAFGDAALMLALQPRAVGKPFWGSRVFELRDGVWMMAESYQVTIRDMPPF